MADDIDFQNEDFEEQNMKPVAGEEANVLWARQLSGNAGHLYYNMPPILSWDCTAHDDGVGSTCYFYKTFHKPSFVDKFTASYYHDNIELAYGTLTLWIDGTQVFEDTRTLNTLNKAGAASDIGQAGQDEWLIATIRRNSYSGAAVPIFWSANIEVYPDWDSI